ncbi:hypothetical protein TH24_13125 [Thalassospira xiamenensis]|nr:hypothetical protein TH24_13125 [Thalassospira xiamenensis]
MSMSMLDLCISTFAELDKNHVTSKLLWNDAIKDFYDALNAENNKSNIEAAVVDKRSLYLPIECKFKLLEKAKRAGCDSFEFWQDYYKYKATYLEPDNPERPFALEMANGKYL